MMVPSSELFPVESWCSAARDRRGRLRRGAAVAAERELDRRGYRRKTTAPGISSRCLSG